MIESKQDKHQLGHVMFTPAPHRQLRAVDWKNNPDQMTKCDGMYWGVNSAHREWQRFRRDLGLDSWVAKGLATIALLITGGGAALSYSEDALSESVLKDVYLKQKQVYDRDCLGVEAPVAQTVSSTQPVEMSAVALPATIGGEVMLPEPSVGWVLAGYGVLGASVAVTAAAIAIAPEFAAGMNAASLFPECVPVLSGLRFAIP